MRPALVEGDAQEISTASCACPPVMPIVLSPVVENRGIPYYAAFLEEVGHVSFLIYRLGCKSR